ncbi:MAG: peptidoglycan DD-metalloendopeptidase family protein [Nitrosomonas sp.]|nr:peptidoglycan DD-metalloendopeptidase family protein [Nitrosomonas sp.]
MLLGCILFFLSTSATASENQKKLEALRHQITTIRTQIVAQEKIKKTAADALQKTEQSISAINRKLTELKSNQQKIDQELNQLTAQYNQSKVDLELQQNQLNALLYQQYTGKEQNYLRTLLNQQDPGQAMRQMYYYRQLSQARSASINSLQNTLNRLRALTQDILEKRKAIEVLKIEYADQSKKLTQEKSKHKIIFDQASQEITRQHHEVNKLVQDEKRISRLVSEINKLLTQKNSNAVYNDRLPAPTDRHINFKSLKGRLSLPVRGKLLNRFGAQRSGKLTWRGLFINASSGSDVKAIAHGQVVFADWLRGFGNLMIIEHAQGYMSLYGNNEALLKGVGDTVRSGDTIATVGNSGGNPDTGLYFELRYQGKAFDPLTWIKIE